MSVHHLRLPGEVKEGVEGELNALQQEFQVLDVAFDVVNALILALDAVERGFAVYSFKWSSD